MDSTSLKFIEFALLVCLLYNLRRELWWRQAILLLANMFFLGTIGGGWKGYLPLAVFVVTGYAAVRLMQRQLWRPLFFPVVVAFIFVFTWLKRYTFLPHSIFLPLPYLTLGLSYIFFRVMHMIVDAKEETLPDAVGFVPYLNYTLNFTSIVSGPIQLYPTFASAQLDQKQRSLSLAICAKGLERVIIGFFKLRVLSAIFSAVQHGAILQLTASQSPREKLIGAVLVVASYPIYLYFNFSGFIDMMIGLASLCHLDLPENFNRPFSAASFIEFWSRWHMTLSNWLKAYVYTPLVKELMSKFPSPKVEPFLGVLGFFVTFFLVGAWHGQTSEFLFFGLLVGGGVALNKLFQITLAKALPRKQYRALDQSAIYIAFCRGLTFTYFGFALIWFWSRWVQIRQWAGTLTFAQEVLLWMLIWLGSTITLALWEGVREIALRIKWDENSILLLPPVRVAWAIYLVLVTAIALSTANVSTPVLYQIF